MEIFRHESLTSTSTEAFSLLEKNTPTPFAVWAKTQSAGRGCRARTWESPRGNFYLSIACSVPRELLAFLPLISANILVQWLTEFLPNKPVLKWPNDLLLDGRKCAGILCETQWQADRKVCNAVIGIGINVEHAPHIQNGEYEVTCLNRYLTQTRSVEDLVVSFLEFMANRSLSAWHSIQSYTQFHLAPGQLWQDRENPKQFYIHEAISNSGHLIVRNLVNAERKELVSAQHSLQWAYQARTAVSKAAMTVFVENEELWTLAHFASADDCLPQWSCEGTDASALKDALSKVQNIVHKQFDNLKLWPIYGFGLTPARARAFFPKEGSFFALAILTSSARVQNCEQARSAVLRGA